VTEYSNPEEALEALTTLQYKVFRRCGIPKRTAYASKIARLLHKDPASIRRIIYKLRDRGLVEKDERKVNKVYWQHTDFGEEVKQLANEKIRDENQ